MERGKVGRKDFGLMFGKKRRYSEFLNEEPDVVVMTKKLKV